MLVTPPCGASSNIALWRAKIKPPVELVVGDLETEKLYVLIWPRRLDYKSKDKNATYAVMHTRAGR